MDVFLWGRVRCLTFGSGHVVSSLLVPRTRKGTYLAEVSPGAIINVMNASIGPVSGADIECLMFF